jgi:hypothetical protein
LEGKIGPREKKFGKRWPRLTIAQPLHPPGLGDLAVSVFALKSTFWEQMLFGPFIFRQFV